MVCGNLTSIPKTESHEHVRYGRVDYQKTKDYVPILRSIAQTIFSGFRSGDRVTNEIVNLNWHLELFAKFVSI